MGEDIKTQQIFGGFISPFIFRIAPVGFFVGLSPTPIIFSQSYGQQSMAIRRISETEYMFLRRIGITEVSIMM